MSRFITNSRFITPRRTLMLLFIATLAIILVSYIGGSGIDGPVLTSPRPPLFGGFGLDAQVGGVVVLDENSGCLFLGNDRTPVVWPAGASWRSDPPAVKLQGQVIEPGMSVLGGGGYHHHSLIEELAGSDVADAAQACIGHDGEVALFNIGSEVKIVTD